MILRSVQILVAWLLASAVCGQVDRMRVERLYARSTELRATVASFIVLLAGASL